MAIPALVDQSNQPATAQPSPAPRKRPKTTCMLAARAMLGSRRYGSRSWSAMWASYPAGRSRIRRRVGRLRDRAQVAVRAAALAQLAGELLDEPLAVESAAVRHRGDDAALALDELGHRLVDRVRREQVPRGDGVALADAVAAVLGLVVERGRPLELQE